MGVRNPERMKQSTSGAVAVAGAAAFFRAWVALAVLTDERWQDVLPFALAVFGIVNFGLRWWLARRNR